MQYYIPTLITFDRYYATFDPVDMKLKPEEYRCPVCGRVIAKNSWAEPFRVRLSNSKFGDLVFDGDFLASQKFKDAFEAEGLTGITFEPLDRVTVRNNRKHLVPPVYYYAKVRRIPATYDPEKTNHTTRGGGDKSLYCPECFPLKNYSAMVDNMDGFELWFKDPENVPDVFNAYIFWNTPFFSQRVVNLAKKYNLKNVLNKLIPTRNYKHFAFADRKEIENSYKYTMELIAEKEKRGEEY